MGNELTMARQGVQLSSLEDAFRFAIAVTKSRLAPKHFDTPEKVMIAVQYGMELGYTPMQALQSIAVINGRPSVWGDGLVALVRASGKMEDIRESIDGTGDKRAATCVVKRRDQASEVSKTFSVADAMRAGLWGKAGPWKQYPDRMLQVRARAFALRDTFADVLVGIQCAEEVRDYIETEPTRIEDGDELPIGSEVADAILGDDLTDEEKAEIEAREAIDA